MKLASSLFLNLLLPPIGDRSESVMRRLRVILKTPLILKVKENMKIWSFGILRDGDMWREVPSSSEDKIELGKKETMVGC